MSEATYDRMGRGYAKTRQAGSRIAARIERALGDAESIVNAGAGSYEPADRDVVAVEPSREMIAQRGPDAARAILGSAERLPLPDDVARLLWPSSRSTNSRLFRFWGPCPSL
jgi:hypothetical protein